MNMPRNGGHLPPIGDMEILVDVRNICYRHGPLVLLEGIGFTLRQRQRLVIAGPPGGGKTTLLHILLGRLRPQSGQVDILGGVPSQLGARKRDIGFIPQSPLSDYHTDAIGMDVLLDGIMPFSLLKSNRPGAMELARQALNILERPDLADARLTDLSALDTALLRLARAIINRPLLLALDHTDSALSLEEGIEFYTTVGRVASEMSLALLVLTRNIHMVMSLADEVLWLNRQMLYYGDPTGLPETCQPQNTSMPRQPGDASQSSSPTRRR